MFGPAHAFAGAVELASSSNAIESQLTVEPQADLSFPENWPGPLAIIQTGLPRGKYAALAIADGADRDLFEIDQESGALKFKSPPDFENPKDAGGVNVYNVGVNVTYHGATQHEALRINVTDAIACPQPDPRRPSVEFTLSKCDTAPQIYVRADRIYDAAGAQFVARGINIQYGDNPAQSLPIFALLPETHANIIRLQCKRETTAEELKTALDTLTGQGLVVMVLLWTPDGTGGTGGTDADQMQADVNEFWLRRWKDVMIDPKYAGLVMANIYNEWGKYNSNYDGYIKAYTAAVPLMRAAGYRMPLVIDATDYANFIGSITYGAAGKAIYGSDPYHNIVFAGHAYDPKYLKASEIDGAFKDMSVSGYAWLWGEFGDADTPKDGERIDQHYLLKKAQEKHIGWIAWSWKNGPNEDNGLDLSRSFNTMDLKPRGEEIIDGPFGLKATSKMASKP